MVPDTPSKAEDKLAKQEEASLVEQILLGFGQARSRRYNFETQWQEASLLAWPEFANTFFYGYDQMPGQKKTMQQIDSSASIASHRFAQIYESLVTPASDMWSRLKHPDKYMMKQRGVQEYFDKLSRCLWSHRYNSSAGFQGQNQRNFQSLGVFGNMNLHVDALDTELSGGQRGLRYASIPVGQMYYVENYQGVVDSYYRTFRWTARQFKQRWPDTFPKALEPALEQKSETLFWGIQYVCPRSDWQPWRLDHKGKRFASYYISMEGHCILEEGGYRSFPIAVNRYSVAPDEVYGRGPAQMCLPAMKSLNMMKSVYLTQGQRAGNPIYLTSDDGMLDPEFHPGAVNKGGMSPDGHRLIDILPTGSIQITQQMMDQEKQILEDAFLITLYKLALKMEDMPQMSSRQVVEMLQQQGYFLAPTMGRTQTEYLGSLIPRELEILAFEKLLPPMPPAMREAKAQVYDVEYCNPITQAMTAGRTAGFMQMVEMTAEIARSTGDESVWDNYDFDTALPEIAGSRGVPIDWLTNQQKLAVRRKQRSDEADREAKIRALPAEAAMAKAQAIVQKAQTGGNTGGTLSGTPPQQMPQVPGNPQGIPGNPGTSFSGGQGTTGIPAGPPGQ